MSKRLQSWIAYLLMLPAICWLVLVCTKIGIGIVKYCTEHADLSDWLLVGMTLSFCFGVVIYFNNQDGSL